MIKFLLGFVTLMVVLLAAYMFTDKPNETPKTTMTKVEKRDVSEKRVEVSETKEVKTSKKVVSVAKPLKDLKRKVSKVSHSEAAIGEGLTLESIENADVSDEEKKDMLDDLVFNYSLNMEDSPSLSEEELLKVIEEDLKKDQI
jgi:hypothetical protein